MEIRVTRPKDRADFAESQMNRLTAVRALPDYQQAEILAKVRELVEQEVENALTEVNTKLRQDPLRIVT